MTYQLRGKTLHVPDYYRFVDDVDESTADKPEWIDTSHLQHFQVQIYSSVSSVSGTFKLFGTNDAPSLGDSFVIVTPFSNDQLSHPGTAFTVDKAFSFPSRISFRVNITYRNNLPRWVKPDLSGLTPTGKVGVVGLNIFGWME